MDPSGIASGHQIQDFVSCSQTSNLTSFIGIENGFLITCNISYTVQKPVQIALENAKGKESHRNSNRVRREYGESMERNPIMYTMKHLIIYEHNSYVGHCFQRKKALKTKRLFSHIIA